MCKFVQNYILRQREKKALIKKSDDARKELVGWFFPDADKLNKMKQIYQSVDLLPNEPIDQFILNVLQYGVSYDEVRCVRWDFKTGKLEYCSELDGTLVPAGKTCTNTNCPMFQKYTAYLDAFKAAADACKINVKKAAKRERLMTDYINGTNAIKGR